MYTYAACMYIYIYCSVQCLCLEAGFAGRGGWPLQPERIDLNVVYMMFSASYALGRFCFLKVGLVFTFD